MCCMLSCLGLFSCIHVHGVHWRIERSTKPCRHVGGTLNVNRERVKMRKCYKSYATVYNYTHNGLRAHEIYRCNVVYLEHGDTNCLRQNDVFVAPCILSCVRFIFLSWTVKMLAVKTGTKMTQTFGRGIVKLCSLAPHINHRTGGIRAQ